MRNRIYTMSRSYTYYDYTYRNVFKINNLFNLLPPCRCTVLKKVYYLFSIKENYDKKINFTGWQQHNIIPCDRATYKGSTHWRRSSHAFTLACPYIDGYMYDEFIIVIDNTSHYTWTILIIFSFNINTAYNQVSINTMKINIALYQQSEHIFIPLQTDS